MGEFRPISTPIVVECCSHEQLLVVAGNLKGPNEAPMAPCVAVTTDDGSTIVIQTVGEAGLLVAAISQASRIAFREA